MKLTPLLREDHDIFFVLKICLCSEHFRPERRADYVLSDYHRVNYLHNKLDKGEKHKRRKKKRASNGNAGNNNIEDGIQTNTESNISTVAGTYEGQTKPARSSGYDELSKCFSGQSNSASCVTESETNGHVVTGRESGGFTFNSKADVYPNPESTSSDTRNSRIYTPTILDGEPDENSDVFFLSHKGSVKESPYAVSKILPNVPVDQTDDIDLPPPAPHGMYLNHQFEKLGGFQNHSFISDNEHKSKPLPPNPFPNLKSHISFLGANLFDNADTIIEGGLYKKNKQKPVPKKRQKIKVEDEDSDDTIEI